MSLKVYFDFLSQPSRALLIFLENCNILHEKCPIQLLNSEHLTEQYKNEVFRFQKVPVIKHGNFTLTESIAIVRYLSREYNIDNNWYPSDSKAQAKVDEYLEWQHIGLRIPCSLYFQFKRFNSSMHADKLTKIEKRMVKAIDDFERLWLADGAYINGNEISIADIFAACELEQPRVFGYNPAEGRPILNRWWTSVRKSPHYEEIHSVFNKFAGKTSKL